MDIVVLFLCCILLGVRGQTPEPPPSQPNGVNSGPFGGVDPFGNMNSYAEQSNGAQNIETNGGQMPSAAKKCKLFNLPLAKRTGDESSVDSVILFDCIAGYKRKSGDDLRTCQINGKWSGINLICEPKQCSAIPTIAHATASSTNRTYTSRVTFKCLSGYKISGNIRTTTCLASSKWSRIDQKCNPVNCGTPKKIANADYNPKITTYPSSVTWTCGKAYDAIGSPNTIRCQINGKWSLTSMTCKIKSCVSPPTIANAKQASSPSSYPVGTSVKYKCKTGYVRFGTTDTTVCQADQTWSKDSDHIKCIEQLTPTPLGFWPLTYKHGCQDTDAKKNHGVGKNLKLATGPTGVPKTSHEFAGTMTSYVKISSPRGLDVGGYGSKGSFTYTSYIYNTKAAGCFFEWWQSWQQTHIWSWSANNLYVHMYMRDGSTGYSRSLAAPLNTWNFMGLSYNYNTGMLVFKVNDQTRSYYVGRKAPKTNANAIFFGHRPNSQNGIFKGKMSCVMLFGVALDVNQMENIRKYCKNFMNHMGTGCKTIPVVKNAKPGQQSTSTAVGAKVKYTCIGGYKAAGSTSEITCQKDKTWTTSPNCIVDSSLQFNNPKPLGYWPLTQRTKCNDVSGNHNHGVCHGLQAVADREGRSNMAHRFTGLSSSYMLISGAKGLDVGGNGGSFTYTSYVYSEKSTACFFEWWDGGQQTHIWSWPSTNLYIHMHMRSGANGWNKNIYAPQNTWSFYGVSFDYNRAILTLKVDDTIQTFNVNRALPDTKATSIYIGHRPNDHYNNFKGKMSCVMLFGKSLSNPEMDGVRHYCKKQPK